MKSKKVLPNIFTLFLIITLTVSLPFIIWHLLPEKQVYAVIIDKTVPNLNYREHKGLMWVLNNLKYKQQVTGDFFKYDSDYHGFYPKNAKTYDVKELPLKFDNVDLIYIADTYGVYTDDYYTENIRGERSSLIYGGLDKTEINTISNSLNANTVLVAEFNAFETPTETEPRKQLEDLLGVQWSGWIGRYFTNLSEKNEEIPLWLKRNYEKQYQTKWSFEGPGFAFVKSDDTIVILRSGEEVGKNLNRIIFSEQAQKKYHVKNNVKYYYWFDIMDCQPDVEVLAYYHLDLTESGKKMLAQYGLTDTFPAVVIKETPYKSYYFAGDFSDFDNIPVLWNIAGLKTFRSTFSLDIKGNQQYFFWNVFYPMLEEIMADLQKTKESGKYHD